VPINRDEIQANQAAEMFDLSYFYAIVADLQTRRAVQR
jgi:hypothetical protein